ncbi:hypothetical protein C8F01DRAFT_1116201 [Mycena amicta]|nr:hypothetical protein C8F01DRAFT_1116201 [Mycena amicta]
MSDNLVFLDLSRNLLTATTISLRGADESRPPEGNAPKNHVYVISSENKLAKTLVQRASDPPEATPIGLIERSYTFFPDKVTLRGRAPMKLSEWLRPTKLMSTVPATMQVGEKQYIWKKNEDEMLSLWLDKTQIAWYNPASRELVEGKSVLKCAYIALLEDAMPILEDIVIAVAFLGQKLQWAVKNRDHGSTATIGMIVGWAPPAK